MQPVAGQQVADSVHLVQGEVVTLWLIGAEGLALLGASHSAEGGEAGAAVVEVVLKAPCTQISFPETSELNF